MMSATKRWLHGLGAAFIGGAVTTGTNLMVAPESFNFTDRKSVV